MVGRPFAYIRGHHARVVPQWRSGLGAGLGISFDLRGFKFPSSKGEGYA